MNTTDLNENSNTPGQVNENNQVNLENHHDDLGDVSEKEHEEYSVEDVDEEHDYSSMSKMELVELAEKASSIEDLKEATSIIRNIKPVIEGIFNDEYENALAVFIEEGNEKTDFSMKPDELKSRFFDALKKVQQRRSDFRQKQENEKLVNLNKKREILDKLKHFTENDETETSLDEVKKLQAEWKKIRVIPSEFAQELWESYKFYLDKFYDNVSINNELKELDRKKNLEAKIELCKKVDELQGETSIKRSMILLNKFHEDWKNIGPVPKEFSDEIWNRFKAASDKIYEQKKALLDKLKEQRNANLELKQAICEKMDLLSSDLPSKPKEWIEKTDSVNALFEEWRKIGPVPKEWNDKIWNQFKEGKNKFFNEKNAFFKRLNKDKNENLKLKSNICERAENLKESEDWQRATEDLKRLQEEWKKIGPVPEKYSDQLWKRFRAACDHFFNRKEDNFKSQKEEQQGNLQAKNDLLSQLETLLQEDNVETAFQTLREIQKQWASIGFVPIEAKAKIQKKYQELVDKSYDKFKIKKDEMNEVRLKEHYKDLVDSNDKNRLNQEEYKIREKIKFLLNDIATWENNIGFFSTSSKENPLIKQIRDKISKASAQVDKLKAELKIISSIKNNQ